MRERQRLELLRLKSLEADGKEKKSKKKKMDFHSAGRGTFGEKLLQAGIAVPPRIYLSLVVVISLWAAYLFSFLGSLLSLAGFLGLLYYLMTSYLEERSLKRKAKILPQLPAFIDGLASALSTGFNLEGAIIQASNGVPPGLLKVELDRVVASLNRGLSLNESVLVLRQRIEGREVISLLVALGLFSTMGGRLLEPFRRLAEKVREQQQVAERANRDLTQVKQAFFIILLLSIGCPLVMMLIAPTYVDAIFNDNVGRILLQVAVIMQMVAVFMFKKMVSIKI